MKFYSSSIHKQTDSPVAFVVATAFATFRRLV